MIRAVLPWAPARQRWLADGATDGVACGKLPPIEDLEAADDDEEEDEAAE